MRSPITEDINNYRKHIKYRTAERHSIRNWGQNTAAEEEVAGYSLVAAVHNTPFSLLFDKHSRKRGYKLKRLQWTQTT